VIDLTTEETFPLGEAPKYLPRGRGGVRPHFTTLLRWILDGAKGPGGRVHLEALRVGGKWVTSKEALQRFAEALTPAVGTARPAPRTPGSRQRAAEAAAKRLERQGV